MIQWNLLWFSVFLPQIKKSSISVSRPTMSMKLPLMILWNASCADCIPKGSLKNGVLIVVNLALSSSKVYANTPSLHLIWSELSVPILLKCLQMWVVGNALSLWLYSNLLDQGTIAVKHLYFQWPPLTLSTMLVLPFSLWPQEPPFRSVLSSVYSSVILESSTCMDNWSWILLQLHGICWLQSCKDSKHFLI